MKRALLALALACITLAASAQKITKNERDEKGIRRIETDSKFFNIDGVIYSVKLTYAQQDSNEQYMLFLAFDGLSSRRSVRLGQNILLKSATGQVLTHTFNSKSACRYLRNSYYFAIPIYLPVDESAILEQGLVKLRINYTYEESGNTDITDIVFPEDVTSYLQKAKKNIDATIPQPVTKDKSIF